MAWFEIARWAGTSVLALASAWLIFAFPILSFVDCRKIARRNEDRGVSGVWLVGSVVGFVAILAAPVGSFDERLKWSWVPLAAEVGAAICLAVALKATGLSGVLADQRRSRQDSRPRR